LYSKELCNKEHFSNDTKPFPCIILCGICLEEKGKSRYFSCPRAKFFHVYKIHNDKKSEIKQSRIEQEIAELELLSTLNQRGILIK